MRRLERYSRWSSWAIALLVLAVFVSVTNWNTTDASDGRKPSSAPARSPRAQAQSFQDGGSWSPFYLTSLVPVHISLLPDGRLFYWSRDKHSDGWDVGGRSSTQYIDPFYIDDKRYATMIDPPPGPTPTPAGVPVLPLNLNTNIFCSGHSFLPDGRLLVSGGHQRDDSVPSKEGIGEDTINIFDYRTNQWTLSAERMNHGRWYPYNVTLANGETLIASGTYVIGTSSPIANDEPTIRGLDGVLRTIHADDNFETEAQYPYISLTPTNKVFSARRFASRNGVEGSHLLDPYANKPFSGDPGVAQVLPKSEDYHRQGTSVQYAPGKVLLLGGTAGTSLSLAKSSKAEVIDLNVPSPTWTRVGDLNDVRLLPTATLLPDGKVLVTGGTDCDGYNNVSCGSIQTPELWDPEHPDSWITMNATTNMEPRVYHSIAMLMPDGRVMVGGGGLPAAKGEIVGTAFCDGTSPLNTPEACRRFGHNSVEFFSPPYLYDASGQPAIRPAIASAPESIAYGQQFSINVGNVSPAEIKEVVLVRLPSVTHTFDQDQRRVTLGGPVSTNGSDITVNAPANGKECPPGPYMMFLISNNGRKTPSIAKIVRVGDLSIRSSTSFFNTGQNFPPTAPNLTGTVSVRALPGVSWSAQVLGANTSWLTIQNGSGAGNGSLSFTVAPNLAPANATVPSRSAVIRISVQQRDAIGVDYRVYQAGNFIDTPDGSLYYPYASKIYARGVTSGCTLPPANFCPETTITRGQGAVMISNLLHPGFLPTPFVQRFADVPTDHAFARSVEYVARRKIIDASSNFGIDQPLTRKDAIIWLLRGLGVTNPPKTVTSSFGDVSRDDPASPFIEEAFRRGITSGCGGGNFCPTQAITRGQMAVFFTQTFRL